MFESVKVMNFVLQAKSREIEAARKKMFTGEKINFTEVLVACQTPTMALSAHAFLWYDKHWTLKKQCVLRKTI